MPTLTVMEGREENSHIVDGFRDEAEKIGWDFRNLGEINSDRIARLDFENIPLDYVIFREMSGNNYHEVERVMEYLKLHKAVTVNANVTGGRMATSDKHFQQGLFMMDPILAEYALPTFEAKNKRNVLAYVAGERVSYPFVLKPRRGTTGDDITLIEKEEDLDKIVDFSNMLIERYVEPECDWRVFVIGGAAVGAMRKQGDPDAPHNFKIWCAGHIKETEKDPETLAELSKIACRAAVVSGLEYAGIDIIREKGTGNYYLLETNIAAGWTNFIPVTHINIPEIVISWMRDRGEMMNASEPRTEICRRYLEKWKKYASAKVASEYEAIMGGDTEAYERNKGLLEQYKQYKLEEIPVSRYGNFIGPETGTFEEGLVLSAVWLKTLEKNVEV